MKKWKNDVAVLLIFFSRPQTFEKVFEQIRIARPKTLFLYQDGPREGNEKDLKGIAACREIAENIDWECDVYKWYQDENIGCDPSEYLAQKWAFSIVNKCIVIEDDDVPSQQFFSFCKEMLDKYENDERVNIISGQNILGEYAPNGCDYFFSKICAIWGWASWRRVIDNWDPTYSFLENETLVKELSLKYKNNRHFQMTMDSARMHKEKGIAYYETLVSTTMYLTDSLNIVPSRNLITNIGIAEESTHSTSDIRNLPHGIRRVFNMVAHNDKKTTFEAPHDVTEAVDYRQQVCRIMGWGYPLVKAWRIIESVFLVTIHSGIKETFAKIKKKIKR